MKTGFSIARTKKISKVAYYILLVLFCLFTVFSIVYFIIGGFSLVDSSGETVQPGNGWLYLVLRVILAIPTLSILWIASRMLRDVSKGKTPFSRTQVKRVRLIAMFLLFDAVLATVLSHGFLETISFGEFEMAVLPKESGDSEPYVPLNISTLALAFVLYCLSLVFEYGCQLQNDSETIL